MKHTKDIFKNKRKVYYEKYLPFMLLKNNFNEYILGDDYYIHSLTPKRHFKKFYIFPKEDIVTLEVGKVYKGFEIYKLLNWKKEWNGAESKSLYYTAPKKYRKIENKNFKLKNKRELFLFGIDASHTSYKKNGSWYY